MKINRSIIGALVGGLILFIWQSLSQVVFNLHESDQQYTAAQEAILSELAEQLKKPGGYMLPRMAPGQPMEAMEAFTKNATGKPWATIRYYDAFEMNWGMSLARSLTIDIFVVFLLIWIINQFRLPTQRSIFILCLFVGLIGFSNEAYLEHVWYPMFDIRIRLLDAFVSWGLCGVWLGYWLKRRV
jgi:hypothetical protein